MDSSLMIRGKDDSKESNLIRRPNILLVGSDHEAAMEHHYRKYLSEEEIHNDLFAAQGIFFEYYNASLLNKIKFKFGISSIYNRINEELIAKVAASKPDLVLVFKGMEIFANTWKTIREGGAKLINYNPDNPFLFSGYGSGNQNIYDSIPHFDMHITYDEDIQQKLERLGLKVGRIPFGFELTDEQFAICEKEDEIMKLCFLGNPDEHRTAFLNTLGEAGLTIDVYGHNWKRFKLNKRIKVYGPSYGIEFWKVLRKYRVQLNLMRPHNLNSHNMRSFEAPAVGAIGLFPDTPDHRRYFDEGRELFLYKNAVDCVSTASELLRLTKEKAMEIRNKARHRSITSGYSYKYRTRQLIEKMHSLL